MGALAAVIALLFPALFPVPAQLNPAAPGLRRGPRPQPASVTLSLRITDRRRQFRPGGITYCHIGQQATATLFAARTPGYKVMMCDGSFEDWSKRDLPVEK